MRVRWGSMKSTNITPSKLCKKCSKLFYKKSSHSKKAWENVRYCSKKCRNLDLVGKPTWNKGIKIDREKYPNMGHFQKHTNEALFKLTKANRANAKKHSKDFFRKNQKLAVESARKNGFKNFHGTLGLIKELSYIWKGNDASYSSKHKWILKHWIRTGVCQNCGIRPTVKGKVKSATHWHNIDGKYDRENKRSWLEVCPKCHKKYHGR